LQGHRKHWFIFNIFAKMGLINNAYRNPKAVSHLFVIP